jgi:TRAP-type C4-dicarboxylate transport system substrate-binding protein
MTKLLFEEESQEKAKRQAEGMIQTSATEADYKRGAERMASYWDEWAKRNGKESQEALKKVREALGR